MNIQAIIKPENMLEEQITKDVDFIEGAVQGRPRPGHPEGQIVYHIREVLNNVDKYAIPANRSQLRLIALIHDTFKHKVDHSQSKSSENPHAGLRAPSLPAPGAAAVAWSAPGLSLD